MDIQVINQQNQHPVDGEYFRKLAERMLKQLGVLEAEISIVFVNDRQIRNINEKHLSHDWATDVITFPLSEPDERPLEGEVVICVGWAALVAESNGDKIEEELALYLAHGLLHLLGQDDIEPEDARQMRLRELDLLQKLGLKVPGDRFEGLGN